MSSVCIENLSITDFGLSKFYIENGEHVQEGKEVIGSPAAGTRRYLSLYAHRHRILSRRDDIESMGYVLIYLLQGDVSWASSDDYSDSDRDETVLRIKKETSLKVSEII